MSRVLLLALAVLGVGCVAIDNAGSSASALIVGEELAIAPESTWASAGAGCEGLLAGDAALELAYAENAPGFVVALSRGSAVCLDSIEAIEEELRAQGASDAAEQLRAAAAAAPTAGDPNPRPSDPSVDPVAQVAGDPNPRPSMPETQGDPNPRPSLPGVQGDPNPRPSQPQGPQGDPNPRPSQPVPVVR